jgi:hypothetical protein
MNKRHDIINIKDKSQEITEGDIRGSTNINKINNYSVFSVAIFNTTLF